MGSRNVKGGTVKFSFSSICLAIQNLDYSGASKMLQGADLTLRDSSGQTLLHKVILATDEELLNTLLENDVDLDVVDLRRQTALHLTCGGGAGDSWWATGAALLLQKGADFSVRDVLGQTPLHLVCSHGNLDLYHTLMTHGASSVIDTPDLKGKTPLHLAAASSSPKDLYIIRSLLEHGASLDIPDVEGQTPLDVAGKSYRVLRVFTEHVFVSRCANLSLDVDFPFDFGGLDNLKNSCLMELDIMKEVKLGQNFLCDLFYKRQDPAILEDNEFAGKVLSFFESPFFNDVFFIYGRLLRMAFVRGKGRLVLLADAQNRFNVLLPNEVTRKILSYVSDRDLINVIEAGN